MIKVNLLCAPSLAAIHALCFTGKDAWSTESMSDIVNSAGVSGWVDERGGFVLFRVGADQADLVTLAVIPPARRHGLGAELLEASIAELRKVGATHLFLEVAEGNLAATSLYRRSGFQVIGARPSYYADGTAAVLMRLVIATSS